MKQLGNSALRILIADDQPDVARSAAPAAEGRGLPDRDRRLARRRPRRHREQRFRRRPDGPQLHPRHHLRPGGPRSALAASRAIDSIAPRRRHDRLGQRRSRGRGHAPRRARLHPEALGQRAPAQRSSAPRSSSARPSAAASGWKPRTACCAPKAGPSLIAEAPAMQPGAAADRPRRPLRRQRADHRRDRHRQGSGRAHAARRLRPRLQADGHRQCRRPRRRRLRERAVRPRQGRVHRRQDATASAASSWPTAARSSSTKSPTFP